jgi:hypothetical protein
LISKNSQAGGANRTDRPAVACHQATCDLRWSCQEQANTTKRRDSETLPKSGNIEPNSDQIAAFLDLLTSSGFTEAQLMLIDDALRETGLQITEVTDVPCRAGNRQ